jgi:predicted nuclease with TOPRIM domain
VILDAVYAIVALLALLGTVAGGYVIIRGSATKTAAESWRDESEAQKSRADRLADQVDELTAQVGKLTDRVAGLEADKARLEDMVTARAEIQALSDLTRAQHQETMATILTVGATVNGKQHRD